MTLSVKKQPVYWLLRGFSCVPNTFLYLFARFVAFLAWYLKTDMRRITELNIAYCFPELSPSGKIKLCKESIIETLNVAVEMPKVIFQTPEQGLKRIQSVEGNELLDECVAKGEGIIILAPHIGSWEYLGFYLAERYDCMFLYKPGKDPVVSKLVVDARGKMGAKILPTNKKGVMGMLKHLRQGGLSGILPDQVPEDAAARITAPFYGHEAPTMTLVSSFAKKPKIKVIAAVAKRLPNKQFHIIFQAVHENIYSKEAVVSAAALNKEVELLIKHAPAQYQWEYKRFKYNAEGRKHALYKKNK